MHYRKALVQSACGFTVMSTSNAARCMFTTSQYDFLIMKVVSLGSIPSNLGYINDGPMVRRCECQYQLEQLQIIYEIGMTPHQFLSMFKTSSA